MEISGSRIPQVRYRLVIEVARERYRKALSVENLMERAAVSRWAILGFLSLLSGPSLKTPDNQFPNHAQIPIDID